MSMPTARRAQKSKKTKIKSLLAFTEQAEDDTVMEEGDGLLSFKTGISKPQAPQKTQLWSLYPPN